MKKRNFWSVLKNNIECAFCKHSSTCNMTYYPKHMRRLGNKYEPCEKEKKKKLNRKLP